MGKLVLYAIGNSEKFSYFIFRKDEKLLESLDSNLRKIFTLYTSLVYENYEENDQKKNNIFKLNDTHWSVDLGNGWKRLDIFFGAKRVYVTLFCNEKEREKFNNLLEEFTEMPEPKKLKKLKKRKNGKK